MYMYSPAPLFLLPLILSSLLSPTAASCIHGTTLNPRNATEPVPISTFSYTGASGPLNWAALSPDNVACSTSSRQSPINIDSSTTPLLLTPPIISFTDVPSAAFENLGTTVEVVASGTTILHGTTFALKQLHFHSPSEHRIDEEYFPLEMHMVHQSSCGSIIVIAVLFELSPNATTPLLQSIVKNIGEIAKPGSRTKTGRLDFAELKAHILSSPLFSYQGSLTTPPCAEGLTFLVPQKPMAVDVRTFNSIKRTVKFNARYTQNLAGEENVLAQGCAAAKNALNVVPPGAPRNSTARTGREVKGDAGRKGEQGHHCILGACEKRPVEVRRRGRWGKRA